MQPPGSFIAQDPRRFLRLFSSGTGSRGIRSLRDLSSDGGGLSMPLRGTDHADDEDDEDEDEGADQGESWFAGGERR